MGYGSCYPDLVFEVFWMKSRINWLWSYYCHLATALSISVASLRNKQINLLTSLLSFFPVPTLPQSLQPHYSLFILLPCSLFYLEIPATWAQKATHLLKIIHWSMPLSLRLAELAYLHYNCCSLIVVRRNLSNTWLTQLYLCLNCFAYN